VNVLVDATPLASGHRWRGIGNYVRHLAQGLSRTDGARFLTLTHEGDGIPLARLLPLGARVPPRWDEMWVLYGRRLRRVIADSGSSLYHFTSAEASVAGNGVTTVATVYDLIPLEYGGSSVDPRSAWRRILYRLYLRRLRAAQRLIAISNSTAGALVERLGVPVDRTTVIPLGIDQANYVERADRRRGAIRAAYGLPSTYWLTVTSPNPNKGWPDLLEALVRARQSGTIAALVIAGHWLPEHRRQLVGAADRLGVASQVRFLGFVPDDDLPALYAEALAFVFPSRREGFGLPVLEAMAVGTPVIVSDDPALHELVGGAGLEFPRGDAAALAERMQSLSADLELRSNLGERATRRAASFTWQRTIDETLAVYRSISLH
jgi:glycosyltransferase involved in cell wall biosynthesis